MGSKAVARIGTSGWQYDHWSGIFYPPGLPKERWFEHFVRHFDTVEVNNTFYHLPRAETFEKWREQAPEGFCFVLKFSRYGSHLKRLKDPESTIGLFLERAGRLGPHLGPILVQLPPHWHADPQRLDAFLRAAPREHRWAVEFRDRSWLCDEVFNVLRRHGAALCIHDMFGDHPRVVTAEWLYFRFHGARPSGDYTPRQLAVYARRIEEHLDRGLDVYAYFNNDAHGYALRNAMRLRRRLAAR